MTKIIILTCMIVIALSSCYEPIAGSGNVIEVEKQFPDFRTVVFDGIGNLNVSKGDTQKVVIRADDNFINDINVSVDSVKRELTINIAKEISPTLLEIDITMVDFSNFNLRGKGNIIFKDKFHYDNLVFLVNSGTGNLDFRDFYCRKAYASLNNSGSIFISCDEALDATIAGSGNIYYRGTGIIIKQTISGTGKIIEFF